MGKREIDRAGKLATQYSQLRKLMRDTDAERKKIYESVIAAMEKAGLEKVVTEFGSLRLFKKDLRTFDVDAAADVLGEELFDEITVIKIDPEILDAKIKLGEIDQKLVDKFTTKKESKELRLY